MGIKFVGEELEIKQKKPFDFSFLKKIPSILWYVFILFLSGFLFYLFILISNNMVIDWGGDYTAQYFVMGYHSYDLIRDLFTGNFALFDQSIYLGSNSIASNAYYGLFSPYNLFLIIFPREWIPWTLSIASIIKLVVAGLGFRAYMKILGVKENTARIAGLCYAFCGYMCFYLWYNNYQDVFSFFPFVLLGIELVLQKKRPWVLMSSITLMIICNFVMAVTFVICAFIYALFRYFQKVNKRDLKSNLQLLGIGFVGFFIGIAISSIIFIPSMMVILDSPKVEGSNYLYLLTNAKDFKEFLGYIFSWSKVSDQHGYVHSFRQSMPILEFFFPPATCRSMNLLEYAHGGWDFDDVSTSFWVFSPALLFFVPALINSIKEKKISHLIGISLFILAIFTPFCYFALMGFSNAYGRWSLFFATSILAYVFLYIDKIPNVPKIYMHFGLGFALLGIGSTWIITSSLVGQEANGGTIDYRFIYDTFNFFHIAMGIELAYVIVVYLILLFRYDKSNFGKIMTIFVVVEIGLCGAFIFFGQGNVSYPSIYNNHTMELNYSLKNCLNKINDNSYYRIYSCLNDDYSANNGILNNYSGTGYFHSVYNFYIDDFTKSTSMRSDSKAVGGYYLGKYQDLDNSLGIKYYILDRKRMMEKEINQVNENNFKGNVPFNYSFKEEYSNDDFLIYQNDDYRDLGYFYDKYTTELLDTRYEYNAVRQAMKFSEAVYIKEEDRDALLEDAENELSLASPSGNNLNKIPYSYGKDSASTYRLRYFKLPDTEIGRGLCDDPKSYLNEIPNIPSLGEEASTKYSNNTRVWILFEKSDGSFLFDEEVALYCSMSFSNSYHFNFYFLDENNKVFMYDDHNNYSTNNPNSVRGFYLPNKVKGIFIRPDYQLYNFSNDMFRYETKAHYENRMKKFSDKFLNVSYKKDFVSFETNLEKNKIALTHLAYDKGWKVTSIDSNGNKNAVKTYLGQGGFLAFVAKKGNMRYEISYETPYLLSGAIITISSFSFAITTYVGCMLIAKKKKNDDSYSNI